MNTKGPSILIVGSGAMASLFAALLSANDFQVKMFGTWKENIEVLDRRGVSFIDQDGDEHLFPVVAGDDPELFSGSQYAIVLVKSYQSAAAAQRLSKCLAPDGVVLTLQNGLGNQEILASELGEERVISGVTTIGATLLAPGVVRSGGKGGITIGDHKFAPLLLELLSGGGFEVEIVPDTSSLVWGKLVINAAINPLTALLGVQNGKLLGNPDSRQLMKLITLESAGIAAALGIKLPYPEPIQTVESVAEKTANNYSSMYIDLNRGSPTEIDAINGAIVRLGEEASAPCEYNRVMWLSVNALSGIGAQK
jgi:2-dehydropantoate 2-reductase